MNASEKLAREIYRIGCIRHHYEAIGNAGKPALMMIGMSLERAFAAAGSNDAVEVIAAIQDLEGFKE
jgi:hypothetical protein